MIVRDDQVLASTGVPVDGDPGWTRVSKTGPARLGEHAYGELPKRTLAAEAPAGFRLVRFVANDVHHFAWSASPDYRYEGGTYIRPTPAHAHFPTWDTVSVNVLYKPGDDTSWAGPPRARPNGVRAPVARVHLWTVRVPANHERASARQGRHRVPDDDHGRRRRAEPHPARGRPHLYIRHPRQQRVALGLDGRGADRAIRPTGRSRRRPRNRSTARRCRRSFRRDIESRRRRFPRRTAPACRRCGSSFWAARNRSERTPATSREFGIYNEMIYTRAKVMYGQLRDVLGDSTFRAFLRRLLRRLGAQARRRARHAQRGGTRLRARPRLVLRPVGARDGPHGLCG